MNTLEDTDLFTSIINSDTLRCTGGHQLCGIEATHLIIWCGGEPLPMCTPWVTLHFPAGIKHGAKCRDCARPIAQCWVPVPV